MADPRSQLVERSADVTESDAKFEDHEIRLQFPVVWGTFCQAEAISIGYKSSRCPGRGKGGGVEIPDESFVRNHINGGKGLEKRPLIFIAHCLGGLVAQKVGRNFPEKVSTDKQKAIIYSKLHDVDYPRILTSTAGKIFLGTPHRGTGDITSKGLLCAVIASDPNLRTNGTILRALETNSETSLDVVSEFTRYAVCLHLTFLYAASASSDLPSLAA